MGYLLSDIAHLTVIYVIAADENGPSKIGITNNITTRLTGLQTGNWMRLGVYGVRIGLLRQGKGEKSLAIAAQMGARKAEALCHAKLKSLDVHLSGEWFDLTAQEALQAIEKSAKGSKVAVLSIEDIAGAEISKDDARSKMMQGDLVSSLFMIQSFAHQSIEALDKNKKFSYR